MAVKKLWNNFFPFLLSNFASISYETSQEVKFKTFANTSFHLVNGITSNIIFETLFLVSCVKVMTFFVAFSLKIFSNNFFFGLSLFLFLVTNVRYSLFR